MSEQHITIEGSTFAPMVAALEIMKAIAEARKGAKEARAILDEAIAQRCDLERRTLDFALRELERVEESARALIEDFGKPGRIYEAGGYGRIGVQGGRLVVELDALPEEAPRA